jgi:hypothetical protein
MDGKVVVKTPVKFVVATAGWTLVLAIAASAAALVIVAALDSYFGVSFVYGVTVAAVLINASGLVALRFSGSDEVNARFTPAIAHYFRKLNVWRLAVQPLTFVTRLGQFTINRAAEPQTATSYDAPVTGSAAYRSRQETVTALGTIHSVIWGAPSGRHYVVQVPSGKKQQSHYATQK